MTPTATSSAAVSRCRAISATKVSAGTTNTNIRASGRVAATHSPNYVVEATLNVGDLSADDVLRLWEKSNRIYELRNVDPELRASLDHLLCKMTPDSAAPIHVALDEVDPHFVLCEWWDEFYKAKFPYASQLTIGAFRGTNDIQPVTAPGPDSWLREDQSRIIGVVEEMLSFGASMDTAIIGALRLIERLELDLDVAEKSLTAMLAKETKR